MRRASGLLVATIAFWRIAQGAAKCDETCLSVAQTDGPDSPEYQSCLNDCELAALNAAAAAGDLVKYDEPPPCYSDLLACGFVPSLPGSPEAAQKMVMDVSGCALVKYSQNLLSEQCTKAIADVGGPAKVIDCMGIAADICSISDPTDLLPAGSSVDDQAVTVRVPKGVDAVPSSLDCLLTRLPMVEERDPTCVGLIDTLLQVEVLAAQAAAAAGIGPFAPAPAPAPGGKKGGGGGKGGAASEGGAADGHKKGKDKGMAEPQKITLGVFLGLALAVLGCAFLSTLGAVKFCDWASGAKYGGLDPEFELGPSKAGGEGSSGAARPTPFKDFDDDFNDEL